MKLIFLKIFSWFMVEGNNTRINLLMHFPIYSEHNVQTVNPYVIAFVSYSCLYKFIFHILAVHWIFLLLLLCSIIYCNFKKSMPYKAENLPKHAFDYADFKYLIIIYTPLCRVFADPVTYCITVQF